MATHGRDLRTAARAGIAYFAIAFAAGFVLGTARVLLLAPNIGETAAVLAELPVMLGIAWAAASLLIARYGVAPDLASRATMGTVGFVLLMLAEILLGCLAFGRSLTDQVAALRTLAGILGLSGQVVFGLVPLFARGPGR